MKRTKVFFFIPAFAGGGAEKQCVFLVNALSQREDMDIGLVHFHEGVNYLLIDTTSVKLFPLATRSNYDPRNAWRANRLFARERPDIVFSWLHASDVFTWGARALGGRFRWIMAERDSWYPPDIRYRIRNLTGRHADLIVSNSEKGGLYWAARRVPAERRKVIGNVLPDDWFAPRNTRPETPLVCFAGRLEAQKNIPILVEAFVESSLRREDTSYVIVGDGSLRAEAEAKAARGRKGAITLLPFQTGIRALFERTSVFVNASLHEGKPNTVIENLALGNRVVLSRIPEHVELVGNDYPFLVAPGSSAAELASVIDRALDAPVSDEERHSFHARLASMRTDRIASSYAAVFRDIAGQPT